MAAAGSAASGTCGSGPAAGQGRSSSTPLAAFESEESVGSAPGRGGAAPGPSPPAWVAEGGPGSPSPYLGTLGRRGGSDGRCRPVGTSAGESLRTRCARIGAVGAGGWRDLG
nr:PREDICTED: protein SPT2 homolog [Bos indicus]